MSGQICFQSSSDIITAYLSSFEMWDSGLGQMYYLTEFVFMLFSVTTLHIITLSSMAIPFFFLFFFFCRKDNGDAVIPLFIVHYPSLPIPRRGNRSNVLEMRLDKVKKNATRDGTALRRRRRPRSENE